MNAYEIIIYKTSDGKQPFLRWLNSIKDSKNQRLIRLRINRLMKGNFGDCKPIDEGVCELRCFAGAGYRVYYAIVHNKVVLLLTGGDKSSQATDIEKAKRYLKDYKENKL